MLSSSRPDLLMCLDRGQIVGRSLAADHAVGFIGDRRLVDDGIEDRGLDALLFAPVLRKDVVDIERHLLVIELLNACFPEEIAGTIAQH